MPEVKSGNTMHLGCFQASVIICFFSNIFYCYVFCVQLVIKIIIIIHLAVILMRSPFHGDNGAKWLLTLTGLLCSAYFNVALIAELTRESASLFNLNVGEPYKSLQILEVLRA